MRGSGSDCCKQHALVVAWFAVGGCGMRWCKKAVKRESNLQNIMLQASTSTRSPRYIGHASSAKVLECHLAA